MKKISLNVLLLLTSNNNQQTLNITNHTNPFNENTSIHFDLPNSGNMRIEIIDIQGQVADVLTDKIIAQGSYG